MKERLDVSLAARGLVDSRSQAASYIKLGVVQVNKKVAQKAGLLIDEKDEISVDESEQYVSRAGLKLASVVDVLGIDFSSKVVLDVGSSTGGFTDYALRHGAKKVVAVDVGSKQLHPKLRNNPKIDLREKTDIRDVKNVKPDVILIDVSFISLRSILPHIAENLMKPTTIIVAMLKPQFEAGRSDTRKGVIKNKTVRRNIIADFEKWTKDYFVILAKRDSDIAGAKGNVERFYKLILAKH